MTLFTEPFDSCPRRPVRPLARVEVDPRKGTGRGVVTDVGIAASASRAAATTRGISKGSSTGTPPFAATRSEHKRAMCVMPEVT